MYSGRSKKKRDFLKIWKKYENMKKKFQSALFGPPRRRTGNNFLYTGGLISALYLYGVLVLNGGGMSEGGGGG